ncbi:armadillo-type protein [Tribonema minus]|uniref:Armadillo-type protein n=1 Tax=Tribonema minus TaxID=303371 RepID=A0A835ZC70_9STRA|nr:armadillo-type protein [Tribonema minus]
MSDLLASGGSHNKPHRTHQAPDTRTGDEGSSKRNIQRKAHKQGSAHAGGGGHGQKGKWDPTDDGSLGVVKLMPGDPNYVSEEEEENYVLVSDSAIISPTNGQGGRASRQAPMLGLSEFKQRLSTIFEEYFLSEDVQEALRSIGELKSAAYHYEVVKRGINMSLDKRDHERELVSKLLSEAYPQVLDSQEIGKGFQRLFEMIDDIQLDAPAARPLVASFLARAVVDEILPPSFLRDPTIAGLGGDIVEGARRLLSRDHVLSRVERVWGPGDGRSVQELKVAIDQLLEEYLMSRQMDEAIQCVRDLNCAHFHHEIVKRAVKQAIDKGEQDCTAMSSLLAQLHSLEVISTAQVVMGFDRLYELVPDLLLDMPTAESLLDKFVKQAQQDGCLPQDYVKPPPAPPKPVRELDEVEAEPSGDVEA